MILWKEDIMKALQILSKEACVFAPFRDSSDEVRFIPYQEQLQSCAEVILDGPNTVKPPKDVLFPNVEKLYRYKAAGDDSYIREILPEDGRKILFGVRPCDVRSIQAMDQVFLTKGYVDSYYAKRREQVTIVALGCTSPERTCFCDSMGLDPNEAPGADVMMNQISDSAQDGYVLRSFTEKGKAFLQLLQELDGQEEHAYIQDTSCTLKIRKDQDLDKKLARMFEHPIWDKVTRGCIGCGTCTFLCPTCYCFDIDNENYGAEGCKYRCWDSCMFSDYTRMAGGANPRPTKKERLRNRYMHKLSYFNERYGQTLCVGCGRCIAHCPSHLDISEFIEQASAADPNAATWTNAPEQAENRKEA